MQKWEDSLLQIAVASWVFFALLLATEVGLLPAVWRGNGGVLFRWQVWLLAGIVMVVSRDFVSQARCRCCGSGEQISPLGLLTSRELLCRSCLNLDPRVLPEELGISTARVAVRLLDGAPSSHRDVCSDGFGESGSLPRSALNNATMRIGERIGSTEAEVGKTFVRKEKCRPRPMWG